MQRLTIKYLMAVTAVIAFGVAVLQTPYPPEPVTVYHDSADAAPVRLKQPFTLQDLLATWQIRFLAYIGSVTLGLHTIATAMHLNGVAKWSFAILLPTSANSIWQWYSVHKLGYHPGSLTTMGYVQVGLLLNSFAFVVLSSLFAIPSVIREEFQDAKAR